MEDSGTRFRGPDYESSSEWPDPVEAAFDAFRVAVAGGDMESAGEIASSLRPARLSGRFCLS